MTRPMPELAGVKHRDVVVRGVRLHVAEAGAGEPVVCLHGWPQNWWVWRGVIPGLADRYRVICPDLRGFGWSEATRKGYEKRDTAADIAALLDALDLRDVRLMGHDWGGVAAWILCLERPDLVRQYLAMNTAHPWPRIEGRRFPDLRRFWYQWVISTPLVGRLAVQLLSKLPPERSYRVTGSSTAWNAEDTRVFLGQFAERERAWASVQTYRTFVLRELAAMVRGRYRDKRLKAPVLWLHGTGDPVIRPFMLQGTEPHADAEVKIELIDGVGHFIADQRPDLVLERALEFFASEG
ncbi:MAG TPA: alpha/beta hydrolase [Thermoleophilaceae bacterium]